MPRSRRSSNKGAQSSKEKMEWRRIDLHIHTMGSKDFQQPDATFLDILHKAEAEDLDIIAFTDHNTVSGYSAMMQEIVDLERWEAGGRLHSHEKERLEEYRRLRDKILVLPGFELTATFGFHILGIFAPETPTRTMEHLLLELNVPFKALDTGETEVGATSDVLTAYRLIEEAGGLVIAAHANSSSGVAMFGFDFGGQTKIAYTQDPHLHALEVTDLESKRRRTTASFFNGSKPQYPRRMHCIQGSDAHRISGERNVLGVGERSTEVLIADVSFEALKELFLADDFSRTRPCRRTATEPFDYVEAARREGASIVQGFHEQMTRQGGRMNAIMRDIVAFANTNGGTIYIGVSPNPKIPVKGVDNAEAAITELRTEVERLVTPPLELTYSVLKTKGKSVIRVAVPKGPEVPHVLEGSKIYLRQEADTSLAMRDEIVALIQRVLLAGGAPAPVTATEAAPEVVEEGEVAEPVQPEATTAAHLPPDHPRTGVEIVATEERKGIKYHSMRDLRNNNEVHNVTHGSARRLWRYAIALQEKNAFSEDRVTWFGDLGLWHKYLRAGRPHYDLVQRDDDGHVHIYYGVTEDGIHGPWKKVVGLEEEVPGNGNVPVNVPAAGVPEVTSSGNGAQ